MGMPEINPVLELMASPAGKPVAENSVALGKVWRAKAIDRLASLANPRMT